jgi:hypothetical protein
MASPSPLSKMVPNKQYVRNKYKQIIDKYVTDINLDIHYINDSIFNESIYNQNINRGTLLNNLRKAQILELIKNIIKTDREKALNRPNVVKMPLDKIAPLAKLFAPPAAKTTPTTPKCNTREDLQNNYCLKSIRNNLISGEINKLKEVTTNIGQIWSGINDYIVETTDIKLNIVFVQENDSRLNNQNKNQTEYEENIDIFLSSLLTQDNITNKVVIDLQKPITEVKQIIKTKINTSPSSYIPLSSSRRAPPPVAPSPPVPPSPPPVKPSPPPVKPSPPPVKPSPPPVKPSPPPVKPSPPPVKPSQPPPVTSSPPPPVTSSPPPVKPSQPPSSKKTPSLSALISDPGNAKRFFRYSNDSDDDTNSNQDQQWKN